MARYEWKPPITWTPDMELTWTVEPCVDNRYAFLTLRNARGELVTIPYAEPPFNHAYVHMNRLNAEHLANLLNMSKVVNQK